MKTSLNTIFGTLVTVCFHCTHMYTRNPYAENQSQKRVCPFSKENERKKVKAWSSLTFIKRNQRRQTPRSIEVSSQALLSTELSQRSRQIYPTAFVTQDAQHLTEKRYGGVVVLSE